MSTLELHLTFDQPISPTESHEAHPHRVKGKDLGIADDDEAVLRASETHIQALRLADNALAHVYIAVQEALARARGAEDDEAALQALEGLAGADVDAPHVPVAAEAPQQAHLRGERRHDADIPLADEPRRQNFLGDGDGLARFAVVEPAAAVSVDVFVAAVGNEEDGPLAAAPEI